jgi:hypothetical protein
MRLASRLDFHASRIAVLAFALVVVAVGASCENQHIGRPCDLGVPSDGGTGSVATITSPALQCPSRICLLPGADKDPKGTGSLCTAGCESNSDCEDGEVGDKSDPNDHRCKNGFVCMWPTTVGNFCCQRFCVCRDFVTEPMGGFKLPEVCKSPSSGGPSPPTCVNVH